VGHRQHKGRLEAVQPLQFLLGPRQFAGLFFYLLETSGLQSEAPSLQPLGHRHPQDVGGEGLGEKIVGAGPDGLHG